MLAGEKNSSIEFVWQTTVSTTNLHGYNYQLGDYSKLGRKGCVDVGISKRETDGTIRTDDLEKDGEQGKGRITALDAVTFGNRNNENSQKDIPKIERQLSSKMGANV